MAIQGHMIKQLSLVAEVDQKIIKVTSDILQILAEMMPHLEVLEFVNVKGIQFVRKEKDNYLYKKCRPFLKKLIKTQAIKPELLDPFNELIEILGEDEEGITTSKIRFENLKKFVFRNTDDLTEVYLDAPRLKEVDLRNNTRLRKVEVGFPERMDISIPDRRLEEVDAMAISALLSDWDAQETIKSFKHFNFKGLEPMIMKTFKIPTIEELEEVEGPEHITNLMRAVYAGRDDLILGLIQSDPGSVNKATPKNKVTPLMYACQKGFLKIVSMLLDYGANINARNNFESTVLHFASEKKDNIDVLKLLLQRGADINAQNKKGWTALGISLSKNQGVGVLNFLLNHKKINVNLRTEEGATPLIIAASVRQEVVDDNILSMLLDAGCYVNDRTHSNKKENDPDYCVYNGFSFGNTLLTTGNPFFLYGGGRETALMRAVYSKNTNWVKMLLSHGAGVDDSNDHGHTPLMIAASMEDANSKMMSLLLEAGAFIDGKDEEGQTALRIALDKSFLHNSEYLLGKGASLDALSCIRFSQLYGTDQNKIKYYLELA